jgi:hypothetical protein
VGITCRTRYNFKKENQDFHDYGVGLVTGESAWGF